MNISYILIIKHEHLREYNLTTQNSNNSVNNLLLIQSGLIELGWVALITLARLATVWLFFKSVAAAVAIKVLAAFFHNAKFYGITYRRSCTA